MSYLYFSHFRVDFDQRRAFWRAADAKTRDGWGPWLSLQFCDDDELCAFQLWHLLESKFQSRDRDVDHLCQPPTVALERGRLARQETPEGPQARLFLALRTPFHSISASTISNVCGDVFEEFGTAHANTRRDTHGAIGSWLVSIKGVDINSVIQACWCADQTFWRHYFQTPQGAVPIANPLSTVLAGAALHKPTQPRLPQLRSAFQARA